MLAGVRLGNVKMGAARPSKPDLYSCGQTKDGFYKSAQIGPGQVRRIGIAGTDRSGRAGHRCGWGTPWALVPSPNYGRNRSKFKGFKCRFAQFPLGHIAMDRGAKSRVLPPLPAHATCLSLAPARPICAWLIENGLASARVKQRPDLAQAEWAAMASGYGWRLAGGWLAAGSSGWAARRRSSAFRASSC